MSEQRPVALGIQGPYAGGGEAQQNPLGMFNQMVNIQSGMLQIQRERNLIAGQTRFGEIMGTGQGSFMDKYNAALSDPVAAAYATANFGTVRQGILAMIQANAEQNKMTTSAFGVGAQALGAIAANPNMTQEQYHDFVASKMNMFDPQTRGAAAASLTNIESQLFDGLPADPREANKQKQLRAASLWVGIGGTPEIIRGAMGLPAPGFYPEIPTTAGAPAPGILTSPLGGPPALTLMGGGGQAPAAAAGAGVGQVPGVTPSPTAVPAPTTGGGGGVAPTTGNVGPPPTPDVPFGKADLLPGELRTAPPRPPVQIGGMPKEQQVRIEKQGEADQQMITGMSEITDGLTPLTQRANELQKALTFFQAGGFATGGRIAGEVAQALGRAFNWSPERIDKITSAAVGGQLWRAQEFNAMIGNQAIADLKVAMTGTGRVMRPEVDRSLASLSADMDPRMLWNYINTQVRPILQHAYTLADAWPRYQRAVEENRMPGYHISQFKSYADLYFNPETAMTTTPGGIQIGPRPWSELYPGAPGPRQRPATPPTTAPEPPAGAGGRPPLPPLPPRG